MSTHRSPNTRTDARRWTRIAGAAAGFAAVAALVSVPTAHADEVAYLVNVTVRPGYNFPNADEALRYGRLVCDKVAQGRAYTDVVAETKRDFHTEDEYQAAYLINQAVNELCPAQIWQLRNSAAPYRPNRGS